MVAELEGGGQAGCRPADDGDIAVTLNGAEPILTHGLDRSVPAGIGEQPRAQAHDHGEAEHRLISSTDAVERHRIRVPLPAPATSVPAWHSVSPTAAATALERTIVVRPPSTPQFRLADGSRGLPLRVELHGFENECLHRGLIHDIVFTEVNCPDSLTIETRIE